MPPGPPRKPTVLKALEGNPGQYPLPENEPVPEGSIQPTKYLDWYAQEVWDRITTAMPDELYYRTDEEQLTAYCLAVSQYREAALNVQKEGAVLYEDKGSRVNPWLNVQDKQAMIMIRLSQQLGLDPASRARIVMPERKKESKFGDLVGRTA